ncbi:hypothetical protein M885DRAFT_505958 [Pelagophyceae sp. CCMP2097]|nr:hypothetical protein M885DRAFT_505958 [Pelagophyceae sp. CCMP2097]|mmetsp:Transcript_6966/g.22606  ORF Transcript_6966/g.22606 Transcript_6966/m.22606 type:complete len:415 (+) Transcript_6966:21-1265(+)
MMEVACLARAVEAQCRRLAATAEAPGCTGDAEAAAARLKCIQIELESISASFAGPPPPQPEKQIRVWMDGAFDMMHFGHVNAFRQGRALGTCLVVGVNDGASIAACKGPAVMSDAERCAMVAACKFVDEVVPHVPYVMDDAYIAKIMQEHRIDFIVHGDDPCIVDGKDVYASAKERGVYRSIPRTEGVSTTDLVGRMLLVTRRNADAAAGSGDEDTQALLRQSRAFLSTSRMHLNFAFGNGAPRRGARVVYVAGAFDLFHAGHAAFLRCARALGDFLVVGVHADATVAKRRRGHAPIMNMQERVLSVLGCRFVDDALIDAPAGVTREMVESFGITIVASGAPPEALAASRPDVDPFAVPKALGIFQNIQSDSDLCSVAIADRISGRRDALVARYVAKVQKEDEYYASRHAAGAV